MGIITLALIAGGFQTSTDIPTWVRISAALAMGIGTSVGGWKIIKTVGGKIMKLQPVNGAAADLSSSLIIFGATLIHLPVSTTHVVSSSIMGVGAAKRVKGVKWGVARRIVVTWVITLPISAVLASIIYKILTLFM
jgi:PiT family inorganic phosphate transporter